MTTRSGRSIRTQRSDTLASVFAATSEAEVDGPMPRALRLPRQPGSSRAEGLLTTDSQRSHATDIGAISTQEPPDNDSEGPSTPAGVPQAPPADLEYPALLYGPTMKLIDIPLEHLGILCDLAPTTTSPKHTQIPMIRRCYIHLLSQMQEDNNVRDPMLWKKLLLLARVLLTPTDTPSVWTREQRCQMVLADDWSQFTLGVFKRKWKPARQQPPQRAFLKRKLKQASSYLAQGQIARAHKILQVENIPPLPSEEIYAAMANLHPRQQHPVPQRDTSVMTEVTLEVDEVQRAIMQAKKCISPCGISSLRYELLKQMIGSVEAEQQRVFLEKLTWLLTAIANGQQPDCIKETTRSTQGVVIPKKDGKIRPLGLRETLVNLTLKVTLQKLKPKLTSIFTGVNYALAGSKKMDELIALMTHGMIANPSHDNIFIDAKNAFNEGHRVQAAEGIKECPELERLFYSLYGSSTKVWLRSEHDDWTTLLAEEGCIQGCVFGPFIFGFTTLDAYRRVNAVLRNCPNSFFGAYSDDGAIHAPHDHAIAAFVEYITAGEECGLTVNLALNKTTVLLGRCRDDEEVEARIQSYIDAGVPRENIKVHPDNGASRSQYGYVHLGVPQGHDRFKRQKLAEVIEEWEKVSDCDKDVKSLQERWVYLYWVVRQKFPFWLRHMSPNITLDFATTIDAHLHAKMRDIIGVEDFTGLEWEQIRLPVKSHGFGIGRVDDTIAAAFVGNVEETRQHVLEVLDSATYLQHLDADPNDEGGTSSHTDAFVTAYRDCKREITRSAERLGMDITSKIQAHTEEKKLQFLYAKVLSSKRVQNYERRISREGSQADKARTYSNDGSFAGAWLFTVPKNANTTIPNETFRKCCKLRLGLVFEELPRRCLCRANTVIDTAGVHFFSCPYFSGLWKERHDAIQNDYKVLASTAGVRADDRKLTVFRENEEGDGKRPDLLIPNLGDNGRDLLLDFVIGHPTCPTYLGRAAREKHATLKNRERYKNDKYLQRCININKSFMPMAFESFGAASEGSLKLMANLVSRASELTSIPYSVLLSYWRKRISTTLQVQNARIIMEASARLLAGRGRRDEAFDRDAIMESVHNG